MEDQRKQNEAAPSAGSGQEGLREIIDGMEGHLKAWAINEATGLVKGPAANATWLLEMVRKAQAALLPPAPKPAPPAGPAKGKS